MKNDISTSLSSGQVLHEPYTHEQGRLIVWEMTDQLILDLVEKRLVTNQIVLDVGYDIENIARGHQGPVHIDHYGRKVPKSAHGTVSLDRHTSSTKKLLRETLALYERITIPGQLVRRINVTSQTEAIVQFNLFENLEARVKQEEADQRADEREKSLQQAMLSIRHRFGKNAILKAGKLKKEARTIARNSEIGGHKA